MYNCNLPFCMKSVEYLSDDVSTVSQEAGKKQKAINTSLKVNVEV